MLLAKLMLLAALVGSAAVVFYGLVMDPTGRAIAFTVAGLFVLGVTSAVISVGLALGAVSAGRAGSGLRAFLSAIIGGLFALGAAGSLAGAVIFGLLSRTA